MNLFNHKSNLKTFINVHNFRKRKLLGLITLVDICSPQICSPELLLV
jgi:hypothetical protein